jgi:two-component system cell cycle sensor histidine kinase/response regulator CckA
MAECADEILGSAAHASELTRGLLAFGRRQPIELRPVEVSRVVEQATKLLSRLIGEDVALSTGAGQEPGTSLVVNADAAQLQQVLVNLAMNARDAMPGGGTLTLSTGEARPEELPPEAAAAAGTRFARITVADTGRGISAENLPRIFEPFFTTKQGGKGSGLGLSVVYGIIRQHQGYIQVRSTPGAGTTVDLFLPTILHAAIEEPGQAPADESRPPPRGTERVLIAEDDPAVRASLKVSLEGAGYRVSLASDGEAACAAAREEQFDLLLLDLVMPRRSGREVLDEVRKHRPGQRALFISGYAVDALDVRGLASLEAPVVLKPVSPRALLRAVRLELDRPPTAGPAT